MLSPPDSQAIQKADPKARRKALIVLAVFVVLGVFAITALGAAMADLEAQTDAEPDVAIAGLRAILRSLSIAVGLGGVMGSVYLARVSRAVCREQRFPPQEMRVIRDTRVVRGREALRRGRLGYALGVGLSVSTLGLAWMIWALPEMVIVG